MSAAPCHLMRWVHPDTKQCEHPDHDVPAGRICWVAGCSHGATYAVSNPAVRLMEALATCSDHLGDLLGNAAKSALRVPAASVTLQVTALG